MSLTTALIAFAVFMGVAAGTIYVMLRDLRDVLPLHRCVCLRNGRWHWQLKSKDGHVIAESTEGYDFQRQAREAVHMPISELVGAL